MGTQRLFIIGSSLFADSLAQILTNEGGVVVIGTAPTPEAAFPTFKSEYPNAVIVAGSSENSRDILGLLLTTYPDLPVIWADPNAEHMQVVTSQHVGANPKDLLAVLKTLTN